MSDPQHQPNNNPSAHVDVVVLGGGSAGLSAALTLSRVRRSVAVVDNDQPRNAPAEGVHNLLALDGAPPAQLIATGRREVQGYGGILLDQAAESVRRRGDRFVVAVADGREVVARRVIVATGLVDVLPPIPGLREQWGRNVLHCPYCHGWEVRDQAIAVLATGPMSVHQALLFRQLSDRVTLLLHTAPEPSGDQWEQLAARGISVIDGEAIGIRTDGDQLIGVQLASGATIDCDAVAIGPQFEARADVVAQLGISAVQQKVGDVVLGTAIPARPDGATDVEGVWAAGNVTDVRATVASAVAQGVAVGAAVNADLINEEVRAAVASRRGAAAREQPFSGELEAEVHRRNASSRRHDFESVDSGRPSR
ncbi:NAD(P)/FAD-dependent oxidoreductase [Nocardia sp. 2YAB30]|uniref:NAD(P)/FAD-dependent oxidoreductase n=1 Tax=unclassified Nocardia TaxID=2637762 RepID=UPI003F9741BB